MLRLRIVTALVLVLLLGAALYFLDARQINWLFGAVVLLGAWEWSGLAGLRGHFARGVYVAAIGAIGITLLNFPAGAASGMIAGIAWWVGVAYYLTGYRMPEHPQRSLRPAGLLSGVAVMVPAWLAIALLNVSDPRMPFMLLTLLVLVWLADIGAFFSGRKFGKRKLAPFISPGKTIAGLIGALIITMLFAILVGLKGLGLQDTKLLQWVVVCFLAVLFSVVGDLFESTAKRECGVKDSGHLLPGHGGILDRIDSITAAAPVFALGAHIVLWQ